MAKASMAFHNNGVPAGKSVIVIARKPNSSVEEGRFVIPSPVPIDYNFTIEPLDPVFHQIYFYISADGVTTAEQISSTFDYDVKDEKVASEKRFYRVDGNGMLNDGHDPVSGSADIIDPYLDGKTIIDAFSQGNRFLKPGIDFTLIPGGGIHLEYGVLFSPDEEIALTISYLVNGASTYTPRAEQGYKTVSADVLLSSDYDNCEIECTSAGSKISVTLRDISDIPEGKWYSIHDYGNGMQNQTVIKTSGSNIIRWNGRDLREIYIGKCEQGKIKKRGSVFVVVSGFEGMNHIGEVVDLAVTDGFHLNTLSENDQPYIGADYPRPFWWLNNIVALNGKILCADSELETTVRPVGKEGFFIVSPLRFRMPNTQGLHRRNLKNFNVLGSSDPKRPFNYGGGVMEESIKAHAHASGTAVNKDPNGAEAEAKFNRPPSIASPPEVLNLPLHKTRYWNASNDFTINQKATTDWNMNDAGTDYPTETTPRNAGYIQARRI